MQRDKRRLSYRRIATNRFLRLAEVEYQDGPSTHRWELAQRNTRPPPLADDDTPYQQSPAALPVDAVDLRVLVPPKSPSEPETILVVAQYRPPLDAVCLEFPAGLVDAGETPLQAALRELHEETGYVADASDCIGLSELLAYEPGMCDSCFHLVTLRVNRERPENQNPVPQFDEHEDIVTNAIPHCGGEHGMLRGLYEMKSAFEQQGYRCLIDAKLYTYALGLDTVSSVRPSITATL